MDAAVVSLPTLEDLQQYVLQTLCAHDRLDPKQTPLYRSLVIRKERTCGLFFQAQGPRQVRTYAVWAGDENKILFYDGTGKRFAEVCLSEGPDPEKMAA